MIFSCTSSPGRPASAGLRRAVSARRRHDDFFLERGLFLQVHEDRLRLSRCDGHRQRDRREPFLDHGDVHRAWCDGGRHDSIRAGLVGRTAHDHFGIGHGGRTVADFHAHRGGQLDRRRRLRRRQQEEEETHQSPNSCMVFSNTSHQL
jgi:hypothetical protein